jgi:23S rRNA pseudouridine1911/1915/1917 synthase
MDEPRVVYEDKNFLAVYKPAGLLTHPINLRTSSFKEPALTDWLLLNYPEVAKVGDDPEWRPGIVHRLDRATSGVLLVPRNQKYFEYLKSLFQKSEIKKTYLALVFGDLHAKRGEIRKPIGIGKGLKRSIRSEKMVKDAVTEYEVMEFKKIEGKMFTLLKVFPKTGRTHQIRVHLSSIHHPVVGDALYGPKREPGWAKRLMLHALSLEWTSEDGKRMRVEADPPPEFMV